MYLWTLQFESLDRQQFLNNLGYSHWRLPDLKSGEYWERIKDVI